MKTASDVLAQLKTRGAIPSGVSDGAATSYIDEARRKVLNECHIPTNAINFPDGLYDVWYAISDALIHSSGVYGNAVKSISEGDTSITYSGNLYDTEYVFKQYSSDLNNCRRLP